MNYSYPSQNVNTNKLKDQQYSYQTRQQDEDWSSSQTLLQGEGQFFSSEDKESEQYAEYEGMDNEENSSFSEASYQQERKDPSKENIKKVPELKPSFIMCHVCNIPCSGRKTFNSHLKGIRHLTRMAETGQVDADALEEKKKKEFDINSSNFIIAEGKTAKIATVLQQDEGPILGLDYVTEIQRPDPATAPRYICSLCEIKCDGSSILAHVKGIKHRLQFFNAVRPDLYKEAVVNCGATLKKPLLLSGTLKSATELEKELGRGNIAVRIELEVEEEDTTNFKAEMRKTHQELLQTEKGDDRDLSAEDLPIQANTDSYDEQLLQTPSESRHFDYEQENDTEYVDYGRGRWRDNPHSGDDQYEAGGRAKWRGQYDRWEESGEDWFGRRRVPPNRREEPREVDYYQRYHGRHGHDDFGYRHYYDHLDRRPYPPSYYHAGNLRYPHPDFQDRYRRMFDAYDRYEDPSYYDRHMLEERRRLDHLMHERHRLSDPGAEQRRIDDILARRQYLQKLEDDRVRDRLERKRHLEKDGEEEDLDMLRLKRFMGSRKEDPPVSTPVSEASSLGRSDYSHTTRQPKTPQGKPNNIQPTEAQTVAAAKTLKEHMDQNPGMNMEDLMKTVVKSMMAGIKDPIEAQQISAALAKTLLMFASTSQTLHTTLQVNQQVPHKDIHEEPQDAKQQVPQEEPAPDLPGLSNTSSTKVPSFLKSSPKDNSYNSSTPDVNFSSGFSPVTTGSPSLSYNCVKTSVYPEFQSSGNVATVSQSMSTTSPMSSPMDIVTTSSPSFSYNYAKTSVYPGYQPPGVVAAGLQSVSATNQTSSPSTVVTSSGAQSVVNTSNVDTPQKHLLDSIRKQTEILRQKIAESTKLLEAQGRSPNTVPPPSSSTYGNYSTSSFSNAYQSGR